MSDFRCWNSLLPFWTKITKDISTAEATKAFELFDKNKTGKLSIVDFQHVLKNLCQDMNKKEIEEFLKLADTQKDGYIHYHQFVEMLLK